MRHFILVIVLAIIASFHYSCVGSQIEEMNSRMSTGGIDVIDNGLNGVYSFSYKGKNYKSGYQRTDSLIFVDKDVACLWDSLKEKPSLAIYIDIDGKIEYFDDENELEQNLSEKKSALTTRLAWNQYPSMTQAYLQYWKDYNYTDDSRSHVINAQNGWKTEVRSFVDIGLNDEISSYLISANYTIVDYPLREQTAVVTFYSDINFSGFSLKSTAFYYKNEFRTFNLEDVFMPTGGNWNDVISSMKFEAL